MKGGSSAVNPFRDDLAKIGGNEFDEATKVMVMDIEQKALNNGELFRVAHFSYSRTMLANKLIVELLRERNKAPKLQQWSRRIRKE